MQSNYNMSNQQLPTTDQQRDLGIIITKDLKWQKTNREKLQNGQQSTGVHYQKLQVQEYKNFFKNSLDKHWAENPPNVRVNW